MLFQNITIHQKLVQTHENNTVIIGIGSDIITVFLIFSPLLHQPLHLAHLALQEPVDADLAPLSVEGDGGEAGERGVYHHARHRLVGDEVSVVVQQCLHP